MEFSGESTEFFKLIENEIIHHTWYCSDDVWSILIAAKLYVRLHRDFSIYLTVLLILEFYQQVIMFCKI